MLEETYKPLCEVTLSMKQGPWRLADGWRASLKMGSAANVSQTLRKTEWKNLMKRLPRTLAEYISLRKQNE
jgi:hypothetical protein